MPGHGIDFLLPTTNPHFKLPMKIAVFITGGTFDKEYNEETAFARMANNDFTMLLVRMHYVVENTRQSIGKNR